MATLSDSAASLLGYLPATYGTDRDDVDPVVARWLEALAFELDRAGSCLEALRSTTVPGAADDTVGSLKRWEEAMILPVAPAGESVGQRRLRLVATLQGRRVAHGMDWTAAMEVLIGSTDWQALEHTPGANQLTIRIPYEAGTARAGQVAEYARRITPANQQIIFQHEGGIVVGVSQVGDDL